MGKEQRPYYENKKAAMLDAQRLQRRSDNFGLSLNALTPARIALASEAFNLVDPLGLDLLSVVRDGLSVHRQRTASIPFIELFNLYLDLKPRDPEYQRGAYLDSRSLPAIAQAPGVRHYRGRSRAPA
jgi:hypothetical protein